MNKNRLEDVLAKQHNAWVDRMSDDTQPPEEPTKEQIAQAYDLPIQELGSHESPPFEQAPKQNAWNDLINHPLVQAMREEQERQNMHVHGPFTFIMNQYHNALRGCQSCGQAWVGAMAGSEDSLRWHVVQEAEEEE